MNKDFIKGTKAERARTKEIIESLIKNSLTEPYRQAYRNLLEELDILDELWQGGSYSYPWEKGI